METGIDSFAAAYDDSSITVSPSDRLRNLIEQIEHADQVGLDVFGIGEHHRKEYLDSAPTVILGAAAGRARASVDGRDHRRRDAALQAARRSLLGGRQASGLLT